MCIQSRLRWYFDIFQPFVPLITRAEVEEPFLRQEHRTNPRLRLLLLAILAMCEASEMVNLKRNGNERKGSGTDDAASAPSSPALTALGRVCSMPDDPSDLGTEHVVANIAAFVSWDMRRDHKASWFYLQQAISVVQVLRLDCQRYYEGMIDESERVTSHLKLYYMT